MTDSTNKPTTVFWIISIVALLWNGAGVMAYLGQAYMTDEALALLPEAEQNFYTNTPAWVTGAFAIAVFAALLGCIGLLLRKKWASPLFLISLIAVLAQAIYNFFIQNDMVLSGGRMIMPIFIIIIAVFLLWYSRKSADKGWLS